MSNFEPVIFCLFLILILGISHGALDNIKGKKLLKLFRDYGKISSIKLIKDKVTKKSRGFGFVTFSKASVGKDLLQKPFFINNHQLEIRPALTKNESLQAN